MNEACQTTPSAQAAVAEWLQPVPWQLFATLEFPWNAVPETATMKFDQMIDTMERTLRNEGVLLRKRKREAFEVRRSGPATHPRFIYCVANLSPARCRNLD